MSALAYYGFLEGLRRGQCFEPLVLTTSQLDLQEPPLLLRPRAPLLISVAKRTPMIVTYPLRSNKRFDICLLICPDFLI